MQNDRLLKYFSTRGVWCTNTCHSGLDPESRSLKGPYLDAGSELVPAQAGAGMTEETTRLLKYIEFQYVFEVLFPRIPLSGILGKYSFLCALCDSAVIFAAFLQTQQEKEQN